MVEYSKEVIKAAEELIEKHKMSSYGEENSVTERQCSIEAAIVSCTFALDRLEDYYSDAKVDSSLIQVKAYLEELL